MTEATKTTGRLLTLRCPTPLEAIRRHPTPSNHRRQPHRRHSTQSAARRHSTPNTTSPHRTQSAVHSARPQSIGSHSNSFLLSIHRWPIKLAGNLNFLGVKARAHQQSLQLSKFFRRRGHRNLRQHKVCRTFFPSRHAPAPQHFQIKFQNQAVHHWAPIEVTNSQHCTSASAIRPRSTTPSSYHVDAHFRCYKAQTNHIQHCTLETSVQKKPQFEKERDVRRSRQTSLSFSFAIASFSISLSTTCIHHSTSIDATGSHYLSTPFEAISKDLPTSSPGAWTPEAADVSPLSHHNDHIEVWLFPHFANCRLCHDPVQAATCRQLD